MSVAAPRRKRNPEDVPAASCASKKNRVSATSRAALPTMAAKGPLLNETRLWRATRAIARPGRSSNAWVESRPAAHVPPCGRRSAGPAGPSGSGIPRRRGPQPAIERAAPSLRAGGAPAPRRKPATMQHGPAAACDGGSSAATLLGRLGLCNSFHPERIRELYRSTNVVPKKLCEAGFRFATDLQGAIHRWYEEEPYGHFM